MPLIYPQRLLFGDLIKADVLPLSHWTAVSTTETVADYTLIDGNYRRLLVCLTWENGALRPDDVSFGGTSMNFLAESFSAGVNYTAIYEMSEDEFPAETGDLVFDHDATSGDTGHGAWHAISLKNCDLSTALVTAEHNAASAASYTFNITPTVADSLIVQVCGTGNSAEAHTPTGGQTELLEAKYSGGTPSMTSLVCWKDNQAASASTFSGNWSAAPNRQAHLAVAVAPRVHP